MIIYYIQFLKIGFMQDSLLTTVNTVLHVYLWTLLNVPFIKWLKEWDIILAIFTLT